jgi:hypothetical protein
VTTLRVAILAGLFTLIVLMLVAAALQTRNVGSLPTPTSTPIASPTDTTTTTTAPATSCHMRGVLPDPACTPGAADPRVTQENIAQTICVSGYTATVRPPTSYTTPLERELIARYGLSLTPQQTELDHLIPLELGGHPRDVRNLWPEPRRSVGGRAEDKDTIENALRRDVCAGRISLAEAQRRVATDWTTAR